MTNLADRAAAALTNAAAESAARAAQADAERVERVTLRARHRIGTMFELARDELPIVVDGDDARVTIDGLTFTVEGNTGHVHLLQPCPNCGSDAIVQVDAGQSAIYNLANLGAAIAGGRLDPHPVHGTETWCNGTGYIEHAKPATRPHYLIVAADTETVNRRAGEGYEPLLALDHDALLMIDRRDQPRVFDDDEPF